MTKPQIMEKISENIKISETVEIIGNSKISEVEKVSKFSENVQL